MDTNLYSVCELTTEQKKAFNKLKKAYKECEKAGIYFVNCYGDLMALIRNLWLDMGMILCHRTVNIQSNCIMAAQLIICELPTNGRTILTY